MIGGEALVPSDVLFWQQRFPDVRLVNHFGPTETTVGCCTFEISELSRSYIRFRSDGRSRTRGSTSWIPTGAGTGGSSGELYIGGAGVAGVFEPAGADGGEVVKDPFAAERERDVQDGRPGRWLPDGNIEFLGRTMIR